ncbi:MAG: hypothetical protein MJ106_01700 [Lentisphaeria bacterium]|nr:hypothetical protein [Lentisphaeria bacterium]
MNTIKRNFTLIEILVAVAILVIMMGFLLQFTGGAQRVWAANTARTEMSAQADAIFSLIKEDLEHIYIVEEDEDLDAQSGWYCRHESAYFGSSSSGSLQDLCFFTQATDGIENYTPGSGRSLIYGVRYHFAQATGDMGEGKGKLYRFETDEATWDRISDLELDSNGMPTKSISINGASVNAQSPEWYCVKPSDKSGAAADADEEYLVADNIKSIQIFSDAAVKEDNTAYDKAFIPFAPKYIRVNVFSVPVNLRNGAATTEDTDRTFSRVFLVKK